MDRRQFLRSSGATLLILPFGAFLVRCKDDSAPEGNAEADPTPPDTAPRTMGSNVIFTSNLENGHSHSFTVPVDGLHTPPAGGVFGYTTPSKSHSHSVEITQEALRKASEGEVAKIVSSKEMDHSHTFTIVKVG